MCSFPPTHHPTHTTHNKAGQRKTTRADRTDPSHAHEAHAPPLTLGHHPTAQAPRPTGTTPPHVPRGERKRHHEARSLFCVVCVERLREMITSRALRLVDVLHLECHSRVVSECLRLKGQVRTANPSLVLHHEGRQFIEHMYVDAEARIPSADEMARRTAACAASLAR